MKDLKILTENPSLGGFIKTSDEPNKDLTSQQKALLNRKGNIFFNENDFLSAQRIFITTGYSDGLTRIADTYKEKNNELMALKYYWLAHNKRGYEPIISKLAELITIITKQED